MITEEDIVIACLTISVLVTIVLTSRLVSRLVSRPGILQHLLPPFSWLLPGVLTAEEQRLGKIVCVAWVLTGLLFLVAYLQGALIAI
jgi:hypothetical protein